MVAALWSLEMGRLFRRIDRYGKGSSNKCGNVDRSSDNKVPATTMTATDGNLMNPIPLPPKRSADKRQEQHGRRNIHETKPPLHHNEQQRPCHHRSYNKMKSSALFDAGKDSSEDEGNDSEYENVSVPDMWGQGDDRKKKSPKKGKKQNESKSSPTGVAMISGSPFAVAVGRTACSGVSVRSPPRSQRESFHHCRSSRWRHPFRSVKPDTTNGLDNYDEDCLNDQSNNGIEVEFDFGVQTPTKDDNENKNNCSGRYSDRKSDIYAAFLYDNDEDDDNDGDYFDGIVNQIIDRDDFTKWKKQRSHCSSIKSNNDGATDDDEKEDFAKWGSEVESDEDRSDDWIVYINPDDVRDDVESSVAASGFSSSPHFYHRCQKKKYGEDVTTDDYRIDIRSLASLKVFQKILNDLLYYRYCKITKIDLISCQYCKHWMPMASYEPNSPQRPGDSCASPLAIRTSGHEELDQEQSPLQLKKRLDDILHAIFALPNLDTLTLRHGSCYPVGHGEDLSDHDDDLFHNLVPMITQHPTITRMDIFYLSGEDDVVIEKVGQSGTATPASSHHRSSIDDEFLQALSAMPNLQHLYFHVQEGFPFGPLLLAPQHSNHNINEHNQLQTLSVDRDFRLRDDGDECGGFHATGNSRVTRCCGTPERRVKTRYYGTPERGQTMNLSGIIASNGKIGTPTSLASRTATTLSSTSCRSRAGNDTIEDDMPQALRLVEFNRRDLSDLIRAFSPSPEISSSEGGSVMDFGVSSAISLHHLVHLDLKVQFPIDEFRYLMFMLGVSGCNHRLHTFKFALDLSTSPKEGPKNRGSRDIKIDVCLSEAADMIRSTNASSLKVFYNYRTAAVVKETPTKAAPNVYSNSCVEDSVLAALDNKVSRDQESTILAALGENKSLTLFRLFDESPKFTSLKQRILQRNHRLVESRSDPCKDDSLDRKTESELQNYDMRTELPSESSRIPRPRTLFSSMTIGNCAGIIGDVYYNDAEESSIFDARSHVPDDTKSTSPSCFCVQQHAGICRSRSDGFHVQSTTKNEKSCFVPRFMALSSSSCLNENIETMHGARGEPYKQNPSSQFFKLLPKSVTEYLDKNSKKSETPSH